MDGIRATPYNSASEEALRIYADVLTGVRADKLIPDSVRRSGSILEIQDKRLDLSSFAHVYVCGAGKASFAMARILCEIVGPYLSGGLVITKHGHGGEIPGVRALESSHPVPDESSLEAGRQMLAFAADTGPDDLVLFCLSGGASALMESLRDGVSLADLQILNRRMLAEGKAIEEINAVRSQLSRIKAGGLAQAFSASTVAVLVLSDVVEGGLATIGSGPFWTPTSDEWAPMGLGNFWDRSDGSRYGMHRYRGPKAPDRAERLGAPRRVFHRFIGSWFTAFMLANQSAGEQLRPQIGPPVGPVKKAFRLPGEAIDATNLSGREEQVMREDARVEAKKIAEAALRLRPNEYRVFVGEATVTIRGDGKGGRCQEIACAAADLIAGHSDIAILAGSTDGTDGPTDVGGAMVDGESSARAAAKGVTAEEALANSDSFRFLEACGGLIYTGPTQSNVNDIVIAIRV